MTTAAPAPPSTIMRFDFEGTPLEFQQTNGEWWANGAEAAAALGYSHKDDLGRLYRRHADEFLSSETRTVNLTAQVGQARAVRLYSPKGLEHLALLGRTDRCRRFRRWILDVVLDKLHTDAKQLEAAIARVRDEMAVEYSTKLEALRAEFVRQLKTPEAPAPRIMPGRPRSDADEPAALVRDVNKALEDRATSFLLAEAAQRFLGVLPSGLALSLAVTDPAFVVTPGGDTTKPVKERLIVIRLPALAEVPLELGR